MMSAHTVKQFRASVRARLRMMRATQQRLAENLKVPHSQVSRWLTGQTIPRLDTAIRIDRTLTLMEQRRRRVAGVAGVV